MADDGTKRRIKKLLALAGNNPSEAEADSAMRMALKLMAKHDLAMADFVENEENKEIIEIDWQSSLNFPWARQIAYGVAQLYFCRYFFSREGGKNIKHTFVGQHHHAEAAKDIAIWLIKSTERAAYASRDQARRDMGDAPRGYVASFLNGAGVRIQARCLELVEEAKSQGLDLVGDGKALVPVTNLYEEAAAATGQYMAKIKLVTSKRVHTNVTDGAAYQRGVAHGNSVSLHKQVQ